MNAAWDDEPTPADRHDARCQVWTTHDQPCSCGADDDRVPSLDDPLSRLLAPGAGSLADRLEQLARTLPRDGGVAS